MAQRPSIPRGVWVLGFVSLLMDISSEMIHALLPLYLTVGLGASVLVVGIIEGIAEATALLVRMFSGVISDRVRNRKWLTAAGYGMGALTKPLFAIATGPGLVFTARFIDRIGKGIRGAPRDALIADFSPPAIRGAAFGLRQSLDTIGAFTGPLLAMGLMLLWANDFRAVFWVAVVPAMLAFGLVLFGVKEPERGSPSGPRSGTVPGSAFLGTVPGFRNLGPAFWSVTIAGTVLTLARFSEAFLILRAENIGVAIALTPLVLVGMNVVFALVAYPAGRLADRVSPGRLLVAGIGVLVAADIVLALATNVAAFAAGVLLWGLHMGLTQGLLAAMVANSAPAELRGTAFGAFSLASGVALLLASAVAGALWHYVGPAATFWAGASLALAAAALTRFALRRSW